VRTVCLGLGCARGWCSAEWLFGAVVAAGVPFFPAPALPRLLLPPLDPTPLRFCACVCGCPFSSTALGDSKAETAESAGAELAGTAPARGEAARSSCLSGRGP